MEDTPNAAAAQTTEATPNTNTNLGTDNQAPKEKVDNASATAPDQFDNFVNANGGKKVVLEKMKQAIGDPVTYARNVLGLDSNNLPINQPASTPEAQPAQPAQPQPTAPTVKLAEGYIGPNDIAALQYNNMLKAQYPELDADYMSKGEYLKEATDMGVTVVDNNGNFNDRAIKKFLDLKKQTIQPPTPTTPITPIPTSNYVDIEGEIDNYDKASQIMLQGEGHPKYQDAVAYMKNRVYPTQKKQ